MLDSTVLDASLTLCPRCGWKALVAPSPSDPGRAAARRAELFERHARRDHGLAPDEARQLLATTRRDFRLVAS